jgi:hypothetical protein
LFLLPFLFYLLLLVSSPSSIFSFLATSISSKSLLAAISRQRDLLIFLLSPYKWCSFFSSCDHVWIRSHACTAPCVTLLFFHVLLFQELLTFLRNTFCESVGYSICLVVVNIETVQVSSCIRVQPQVETEGVWLLQVLWRVHGLIRTKQNSERQSRRGKKRTTYSAMRLRASQKSFDRTKTGVAQSFVLPKEQRSEGKRESEWEQRHVWEEAKKSINETDLTQFIVRSRSFEQTAWPIEVLHSNKGGEYITREKTKRIDLYLILVFSISPSNCISRAWSSRSLCSCSQTTQNRTKWHI